MCEGEREGEGIKKNIKRERERVGEREREGGGGGEVIIHDSHAFWLCHVPLAGVGGPHVALHFPVLILHLSH